MPCYGMQALLAYEDSITAGHAAANCPLTQANAFFTARRYASAVCAVVVCLCVCVCLSHSGIVWKPLNIGIKF